MFRLSRIFKTISSIGFIAILVISYAYMASDQEVALEGRKIVLIDLESFFYYMLGLFIFINLLIFIFEKVLSAYQRNAIKQNFFVTNVFLAWLNTFNISVNILLSTYVLFVGFLNSDSSFKLLDYSFLLYAGPILIVVCLILLPVLFIKYR